MTDKKKLVYFAAAIRGDRVVSETVIALIKFIQSLGVPVLSEHIATADPVATLAEKIGKTKDTLSAQAIERQDIAWLDQATHVIAEISGASTGTGREIEYARNKAHFGKTPANVLCLYHKEREYFASPMIRGMLPDRYHNVTVRPYETPEEAKTIIQKFLEL